jgi:hypothetical protein
MNRALRVGDWITFRDGALEELRKVHKWLPTQEEWDQRRDLEARIVVRSARGSLVQILPHSACVSFSVWMPPIYCWPHHVRLDDRPRRWAAHDRIEAEKLAARAKRAAHGGK